MSTSKDTKIKQWLYKSDVESVGWRDLVQTYCQRRIETITPICACDLKWRQLSVPASNKSGIFAWLFFAFAVRPDEFAFRLGRWGEDEAAAKWAVAWQMTATESDGARACNFVLSHFLLSVSAGLSILVLLDCWHLLGRLGKVRANARRPEIYCEKPVAAFFLPKWRSVRNLRG